jgi:hypothetical protein
LGALSRYDLEPLRNPGVGRTSGKQAAELVIGDGADGAFVVRFTDGGDVEACHDLAMTQMVGVLRSRLNHVACWDVRGSEISELRYWDLKAVGRRYHSKDLLGTRTAASMAAMGATHKEHRSQIAALPPVDEEQARRSRRAENRARDRAMGLDEPGQAEWRATEFKRWRTWLDTLAQAGASMDSVPIPAAELGHLAALLSDMMGRDAVMALLMERSGKVGEQVARGMDSPEAFGSLLDLDRPPEPYYVEAAPRLFTLMLAHQSPQSRGPGLALLAWFYWWHSDGAHADVFANKALAVPNPPSLAGLVRDMVDRGALPGAIRCRAA